MANRTVINPALQSDARTMVNADIVEQYNLQNGITSSDAGLIGDGTTLCEKYVVQRRLEVASGEADLYLCSCDGARYVAKVYKRKFAIKPEVTEALRTISSPYVAKLFETGTHNGYPVEILPFYENGSLQGKLFTFDELQTTVIPNINEGLRAIHDAGIIHKDLKPSNLMLNDDGKSISIIDFGISSTVEDGHTFLMTKTGMTPEYSAPETFKNLFYEGSDYYSFGISLFELFCGYTPYANMQPDEIEQYHSVQRIPFPDSMPILLQDFISALTYHDISNRKDANNPNRRWTYDEVRRWLRGETLAIPGKGGGSAENKTFPPYHFMGKKLTSVEELVTALSQNWEEGKKQLFRGRITAHFRTFNAELARKCQAAEEEAGRENGKDDVIFWNLLYQLNPKLNGFYWKGNTYESLPAFGRDVLERLWSGDDSQFSYYNSILSEKLLSRHVARIAPKNEKLKKAASALEDSYKLELANGSDMRRTYYLMAYTLSGQKLLLLNGHKIRTIGELFSYMHSVLDESIEDFEALCHSLVNYGGRLDFQLETWLLAIGKQKELEKWRHSMNE